MGSVLNRLFSERYLPRRHRYTRRKQMQQKGESVLKMKKIAALGLTAALAVTSTGISAFASEYYPPSWCGYYDDDSSRGAITDIRTGEVIRNLPTWEEAYAYLDYDSAPDELKDKILTARCGIVYSKNARWTVNGQASILNADGTTTELPEFSSIYPSDWNLADISAKYQELTPAPDAAPAPLMSNAAVQELTSAAVTAAAPASLTNGAAFGGMVTVPKNLPTTQASPFYYFTGSGSGVRAYAAALPIGYTINLGIKNMNTNLDVVWAGNLTKYQTIKASTINGTGYSVRCNSYNGSYSAFLCVEDY